MRAANRTLRLVLGVCALILLIGWVWRTQHQHADPLPSRLQAGKHGNRHLPSAH